ncbi:MAG: NUDIX domain-containing protein [Chloroflexi bacterium]|nr:NUDIX domain-containing protein [Chloroflexota bacterium]
MSPLRPDIVAVWVYRAPDPGRPDALEILLIRRAPGRELAGLWQCVTGSIESGERIALAALRELGEETGIAADAIEAFYDLDLVIPFHWPDADAILSEVVFAVRVRRDVEPVLSREHDTYRWVDPAEAARLTVWPSYRESIERIVAVLTDPARALWLETTLEGRRVIA